MTEQTLNACVAGEIRAELARQALTHQQLALRLGWTKQMLSRRLNGQVPFSTDDLEHISLVLGIPLSTLTSPRARAS